MSTSWALTSRRVVANGQVGPGAVRIVDERITHVAESVAALGEPVAHVEDVGDLVVMAGIVDSHVHVNEPGREAWEGYRTATAAAAAGGVTTLVDMPLNSQPATLSPRSLATKLEATADKLAIDVALWGGVVPGNAGVLRDMLRDGVVGFKAFMIDSGVPEFPWADEATLREALVVLRDVGAPLLVHAELQGPIDVALADLVGADFRRYHNFLKSRPKSAEDAAVALMIRLASELGGWVHIVHHCSSTALPMLAEARAAGLRLTAETCPHYLHFCAEEIGDGRTEFKCVPPIRERDNREALWGALNDGLLDQIVTDHSPCTPDLKLRERGDFAAAWGGIASLQLGLSAVWTEAHQRAVSLPRLSEWLSAGPARLAGLGKKGRLVAGGDADLVVWDPAAEVDVDPARLLHKNPVTPYAAERLRGVVHRTYVRGALVYGRDGGSARPRHGRVILGRG